MKMRKFLLFSGFLLSPFMVFAQDSEKRIDVLQKAISSEKLEVYIVDAANESCNKVIPVKKSESSKNYMNFRSVGWKDGRIYNDGRVDVPWRLDVKYDSGRVANIVKSCNMQEVGVRKAKIGKVYTTGKNFPYAWQTNISEGYCNKNAIYTTCRKECLQRVTVGSPVFAFIFTKELAEKISKVSCK